MSSILKCLCLSKDNTIQNDQANQQWKICNTYFDKKPVFKIYNATQ